MEWFSVKKVKHLLRICISLKATNHEDFSEFSGNGWKRFELYRFLARLRKTGTTKCKHGMVVVERGLCIKDWRVQQSA